MNPAYGEMFDAEGVQRVWNSHSVMDAEKCLRYYQLSTVEGWHLPEQSVHLTFGGIIASAFQHFYLHQHAGASREDAIREVVREALVTSWGWESEHHLKNRHNLIRTIVWYFDHWKDDLPVMETSDGPAVEKSFRITVDGGNEFVGMLDRVVRYEGQFFAMDQKTTGFTISNYWFEQWNPHTQMSFYDWAGRAILPEPIEGMIIDGMQIAVGFTRFARLPIYHTDAQLEEWYNGAMYHIEAAQRATREQHFPMNPSSCSMYGGCVFRRICSRSPEARENFLRKDFVRG